MTSVLFVIYHTLRTSVSKFLQLVNNKRMFFNFVSETNTIKCNFIPGAVLFSFFFIATCVPLSPSALPASSPPVIHVTWKVQ